MPFRFPSRCYAARLRKAYTLTELLVVIGILGILTVLLFPVFAQARERGRQIYCTSTLANFGKAFMMYADDYDGRLPNPGGRGMLANATNAAVPAAKNGAVWYSAWYSVGPATVERADGPGAIVYYMNGSKDGGGNWACLDAKTSGGVLGTGIGGERQSYSMNDYLREGHPGQYAASQGDVSGRYNPSYHTGAYLAQVGASAGLSGADVILLYEAVQRNSGLVHRNGSPYYGEDDIGRYGADDLPQGVPEEYHQGRSNFLFCDGHVKLLDPVTTWTKATQPQVDAFNPAYSQARGGRMAAGGIDAWNPHLPFVQYP